LFVRKTFSYPFDGVSLRPILENPAAGVVKELALSVFPRCAHVGMPSYGARGIANGSDNTCLEVERTDFTWMGHVNGFPLKFAHYLPNFCLETLPNRAFAPSEGFAAIWHRPLDGSK
jgi:hypothetical protein